MTLTCVWLDKNFQRVGDPVFRCSNITEVFNALTFNKKLHFGHVLRAYNAAVSFYFGFNSDGDFISANSKSDYRFYLNDNICTGLKLDLDILKVGGKSM